jgi:hypothetical protein
MIHTVEWYLTEIQRESERETEAPHGGWPDGEKKDTTIKKGDLLGAT